MTESGVAEAGWFYVEGDPPGTVRRWNGFEWIGFPIPDPSAAATIEPAAHRPSRLSPVAALLSVLTLVTLTALAATFALAAARTFANIDTLTATVDQNPSTGSQPLRAYVEGIGGVGKALIVGMLVNAFVFIIWIRTVAKAAQVHRFKRHRAASTPTKRSTSTIVIQVLIFGIFAPIWWGIRGLLSGISNSAGGGNTGLFSLVSDTAMASSMNPKTGLAEIGPIKIMVWFGLWWGSALVAIGAWGWLWVTGTNTINTIQTVVQLTGVLLALESVSLILIMLTVGQITARLVR